jgi:hypothetical protein
MGVNGQQPAVHYKLQNICDRTRYVAKLIRDRKLALFALLKNVASFFIGRIVLCNA